MKLLGRFQYADNAFPATPTVFNGQKNLSAVSLQSTTYPQTPIVSMGATGVIRKIRVETNINISGSHDYTGTMRFRLFENGVLIWEGTDLAASDWDIFTANTTTIPQGTLWYDVNIPFVETDQFAGTLLCTTLVGGPLGQKMTLFGTTS